MEGSFIMGNGCDQVISEAGNDVGPIDFKVA